MVGAPERRRATCRTCPSNELTPTALAEHALGARREIDGARGARCSARTAIARARHGRPAGGGARAPHEEPRLIVMRYDGGGEGRSALVGKAVTFDTGGISIKPAGKMEEMKMDMSGGAAVIEATAAIARLGPAGQPADGRAGDREHALRPRGQARRHHHDLERQDGRGQQHRRRGPADPGRRARLCGVRGRRADHRPRDADRRDHHRARLDLRGPLLQRRRASRGDRATPATRPARSSGGCRCIPTTRT